MIWERREEARREQMAMHWRKAAVIWRDIGDHANAEACEAIQDACDKGDRFRARVTELIGEATVKAYAQANKEIYG